MRVIGHMLCNNSSVDVEHSDIWFQRRVLRALKHRKLLFGAGGSGGARSNSSSISSARPQLLRGKCYRLLNGEGDQMPGVFADRFGRDIVVNFTLPAPEALKNVILQAIYKVVERNERQELQTDVEQEEHDQEEPPPLRYFILRRDDPMRRIQHMPLIERPLVLNARTLEPLSVADDYVRGHNVISESGKNPFSSTSSSTTHTSHCHSSTQDAFERHLHSVLYEAVVEEESGRYENVNILEWDYGLRDVRTYLRSSTSTSPSCRLTRTSCGSARSLVVDVCGNAARSRFFESCATPVVKGESVEYSGTNAIESDARYTADNEREATKAIKSEGISISSNKERQDSPNPSTTNKERRVYVERAKETQRKLHSQVASVGKSRQRIHIIDGRVVDPSDSRALYGSSKTTPSSLLILDIPRVCPTNLHRAISILRAKITSLLREHPLHRYRSVLFIVRDRLTNNLLHSILPGCALTTGESFSNPADFPIHLATPKNTHLRAILYHNEKHFGRSEHDIPKAIAEDADKDDGENEVREELSLLDRAGQDDDGGAQDDYSEQFEEKMAC
ncbi:unnamed protein product [Amoebophrya sp. A25]|nr:unnamed protein product [Amoebophrya sp. A25]|eukprot:GSA25T00017073001.1